MRFGFRLPSVAFRAQSLELQVGFGELGSGFMIRVCSFWRIRVLEGCDSRSRIWDLGLNYIVQFFRVTGLNFHCLRGETNLKPG